MKIEVSVRQRSFGTQGIMFGRVRQALQALSRSFGRRKTVLRARPATVVKALQDDRGLPTTDILNAAALRAFNVKLSKLSADAHARAPPVSRSWEVFEAANGSFEISRRPPPNSNGAA